MQKQPAHFRLYMAAQSPIYGSFSHFRSQCLGAYRDLCRICRALPHHLQKTHQIHLILS